MVGRATETLAWTIVVLALASSTSAQTVPLTPVASSGRSHVLWRFEAGG